MPIGRPSPESGLPALQPPVEYLSPLPAEQTQSLEASAFCLSGQGHGGRVGSIAAVTVSPPAPRSLPPEFLPCLGLLKQCAIASSSLPAREAPQHDMGTVAE